jgi:tetratricopeptide (TPR) repeat protein
VEPKGDKTAVRAYLEGKSTLAEGKVEDAKNALTTAIERFARHALAYERRGFINIQLKNYTDALYDYDKSLAINPHHADAYYGRAMVKIFSKNIAGAIEDLESTVKKTFPLQPMYWQARNKKGDCHIQLKQYDKAAFEYKFFTKRVFDSKDPNFPKRKKACCNYVKALMELGDYQEALIIANKALAIEDNSKMPFNLLEMKEIAAKEVKLMPVAKKPKAVKKPKAATR